MFIQGGYSHYWQWRSSLYLLNPTEQVFVVEPNQRSLDVIQIFWRTINPYSHFRIVYVYLGWLLSLLTMTLFTMLVKSYRTRFWCWIKPTMIMLYALSNTLFSTNFPEDRESFFNFISRSCCSIGSVVVRLSKLIIIIIYNVLVLFTC